VELYTDTSLTTPDDRHVAISGLAHEIQKHTKDAYFAGLWRKDILRGILWHLEVPQRVSPVPYRAPSWSWAAAEGKMEFLARRPGAFWKQRPAAVIKSISTTGMDGQKASTGQLQDGYLLISGPLREAVRCKRQVNGHRLGAE